MIELIKTAALGTLALGSVAFSLPASAFNSALNQNQAITTETIYRPQTNIQENMTEMGKQQVIAQRVCDTAIINGVSVACCKDVYSGTVCCADQYGNWACQ